MKKAILSFLLIGSAAAVMAQQPTPTTNSNLNSNRNNKTNTNLNNNNSNVKNGNPEFNNSNMNNNQNVTNAGRDTTMSMGTNPTYNNGTSNQVNQTMTNAQVISSPEVTTTASTVNVPTSIRSSFSTSHPAVSGNVWSQSGDWYVSRYVDNGTIKQTSYREDGKTLSIEASPQKTSFVSDDAMSQAIQKYGANVYSVASVKGADGQDMYAVRVIENGQAKTVWMNQDGSVADNHFRKEEEQNSIPQQQQPQ